MWLGLGGSVFLVLAVFINRGSGQIDFGPPQGVDECDSDGCRLAREAVYFITSPSHITPGQLYQMSVSILNMYYSNITVTAYIRRNKAEEVTSASHTFEQEGTTMMQMLIPDDAQDGQYDLRVEGTENTLSGGYLFENVTDLVFDQKWVSVLIHINKPIYRHGQTVHFRVMPVKRNLMSHSGSMDVYMIDATDNIVKRWPSMQTNAGGVLDMTYQLDTQPAFGTWKIRVDAFGHQYFLEFEVYEIYTTTVDTNISMPLYHLEDDFAIAGIIDANLTLGQGAHGNVSVFAQIRPALRDQDDSDPSTWPIIRQEERLITARTDFMFTMEELREANGGDSLAGKEIYVEATAFDWFRLQSATGFGITVIHSNQVRIKVLGDQSRTFKPRRMMHVYFALFHDDGSPLDRVRRQVTITRTARKQSGSTRAYEEYIITRDDGICHYQFIPEDDDLFQSINAYYDLAKTDMAEVRAYRFFSPSNNYVYITTSTETPEVDKYMVFTVTSTVYVPEINYVITAGGAIISGSTLDMESRQTTFSLALSRDMIPQAHIVVWYIYKGEVISDSINFFINGTRLNPIDLEFNRGKDFTGDTVEMTIRTDPSSFIATHAIDHHLWVHGWNPFITEANLVRELESYEYHVNNSFRHVFLKENNEEVMIHFPAPSYAIDSNTTFAYTGLLVMTDAQVTRLYHNCNESIGLFPCMDGGNCFTTEQWCDGVAQCEDMQDEMGCSLRDRYQSPFTHPRWRLGLLMRHIGPLGDWMWQSQYVMPNGRLDITVEVPDEPMTWVVGGFGISREKGFGMIHDHPRHEASRMFFMRSEAASEAIKGEQVGVRLGLFNFWMEYLEAIVVLHHSEDYRFVVVEEFGIVSSYNPRTIHGDVLLMVYLEPQHYYEVLIPVLPVKDGCITVSISARTFIYTDMESVEICTKYDGVTNYYHTPYFVDLISSGSMRFPDLEIPVPEQFIRPNLNKHLYVPGSPQCRVGIVGDVVGPGFYEDFLNTENTLRKPYGGAEANIYNFAFNLYMIIYLKETDQLQDHVLHRTISYLDLSLQRQMGYMNSDGSFSMFRDYIEHTPSVWTTASVLRVLNNGNQREWENFFYIPDTMLSKIVSWLCGAQHTDGFWREQSPVYDRKMWPKDVEDSDGNLRRIEEIPLTAYVLISMQEANQLTSDAQLCRAEAVVKGRTWLNSVVFNNTLTDPYQLAIVTYALQVTGAAEALNAFNQLRNKMIRTEFLYWADKEVPPNDVRSIDTYPYYQPRKYYDNEAYAVEATAYGMLAHMRYRYMEDAKHMMKWLQSMRNTFAAQASTQDSIMALQALTEYAKRDTNRWLYRIEFHVQATSMGENYERVYLDNTNWPEMQSIYVDPVWGSVRGDVRGSGIALIQMETQMNVEWPEMIEPQALEHYFDVTVHVGAQHQMRNASFIILQPCARWVRPDISNQSGMAVIELDIPSGYRITMDVLRAYAASGEVPTLHRAELRGRRAGFYFDYLDEDWTCVNFRIDRWYPVANLTIQHLLRVYDYYEPGMFNQTLYETFSLFQLHVCQVCASFQCPYCPYYNTASVLQFSLVFSFIVTFISFFLSKCLYDNCGT